MVSSSGAAVSTETPTDGDKEIRGEIRGEIQGFLDKVTSRRVTGWAKFKDSDAPVTVELLLDGQVAMTTLADVWRRGLLDKGIHPTGCCAYEFILPAGQEIAPGTQVRTRIAGTSRDLNGSPRIRAPEEARPAGNREQRLFFLHIAKTAGSAANNFIASHFDPERVRTHIESLHPEQHAELPSCDFVSGHIRLKRLETFLNVRDYTRFVIFRRPIDHIISHIAWVRHLSEPGNEERFHLHAPGIQALSLKLKGMDLSDPQVLGDFVANFNRLELALFDNCQTRYLISAYNTPQPVTEVQAREALSVVETFDVVGLTERYDDTMALLCTRMKWPPPPTGRLRKVNTLDNKFGLDASSPAIYKALAPAIAHDEILYEKAGHLFEHQFRPSFLRRQWNAATRFLAGLRS